MSHLRVLDPVTLDGPASLPRQLRKLADELEQSGKTRTAIAVLDDGKGVEVVCLGYRPRRSETAGLLAFAQHMILDEAT
jgi:hypothetical protein